MATASSSSTLPSLPSATWLDECLLAARSNNKIVGVRFGRNRDPLCATADAALLAVLAEAPFKGGALDGLLSIYTVDLDAVPEFTFMYELYDPYTIMIFHRSKPLLFDSGFGQTRKLTELDAAGAPPLGTLLAKAVKQALDLESPLDQSLSAAAAAAAAAGIAPTSGVRDGDERPDDAATYAEEASRLARQAGGWLSARLQPAVEKSGEYWEKAESGWNTWAEKTTRKLEAAKEAAKAKVLEKVQEYAQPSASAPSPAAEPSQ